jgi:HAD superfamily hydrolase (TIGR01509 family)
MIRAIFFDCFGVLYVDASHAYFSQFPEHHEALYDLNKQADHGFIDRDTYIKAVARVTSISEQETVEAFKKEHVINQPLVDYIRTELKPRFKIGLISNIGRDWIHDFFDQHALHDLFDGVVLSSEEGITKPNPLIFERALSRLNVFADESFFIDDNKENCEGAKSIGMQGIMYTSLDELKKKLEGSYSENRYN